MLQSTIYQDITFLLLYLSRQMRKSKIRRVFSYFNKILRYEKIKFQILFTNSYPVFFSLYVGTFNNGDDL